MSDLLRGALLLLLTTFTGPAELQVIPEAGLAAAGFPLGPLAPASLTCGLRNSGTERLSWSASRTQPWISLSPAGGNLAGDESNEVTVWFNGRALELPRGTHHATIVFSNVTADVLAATRSVELTIVLPGAPSVELVTTRSNTPLLRLTGQPGSDYVIESSTNLTDWKAVLNDTFTSAAAVYDFNPPAEAQRFFRGRSGGKDPVSAFLSFTNRVTVWPHPNEIQVVGEPGGLYLLEGSADSTQWVPLATNKLCDTDRFYYTNVTQVSTGWFYRARPLDTPPLSAVDQILIVGQSLAIGYEGWPSLTTEPSRRHFFFSTDGVDDALRPLFEPHQETIASSAALQASCFTPDLRLVFSNVGVGSAPYSRLQQGTANFALGLEQFRRAPAALACGLAGCRPAAIFAVHGESDWDNRNYDADIRQWQEDYAGDVRRLSGYDVPLPMFHTQMSSWTALGTSQSVSPFKLLAEAEANPDRTILVGPRYFLSYALPGGIHLDNFGYRRLGAYYGKVYRRLKVEGSAWTPLKPVAVTRAGAVITAQFDVPVPPLVLDTNQVSDPGNCGFEYADASPHPPRIAAVALTGPVTVQIVLETAPTGANPRLRFAYTGVPGRPGGPKAGSRGNLRDSDAELSWYGEPLYNWCVHFDKPVETAPGN